MPVPMQIYLTLSPIKIVQDQLRISKWKIILTLMRMEVGRSLDYLGELHIKIKREEGAHYTTGIRN